MLPFIFSASLWLAFLAPIIAVRDELAAAHRELAAIERDLARQGQSPVHPQVYIEVYMHVLSPPEEEILSVLSPNRSSLILRSIKLIIYLVGYLKKAV